MIKVCKNEKMWEVVKKRKSPQGCSNLQTASSMETAPIVFDNKVTTEIFLNFLRYRANM